jgi:hypothetical protein
VDVEILKSTKSPVQVGFAVKSPSVKASVNCACAAPAQSIRIITRYLIIVFFSVNIRRIGEVSTLICCKPTGGDYFSGEINKNHYCLGKNKLVHFFFMPSSRAGITLWREKKIKR